MGTAEISSFVGIQRRVNAAKDHVRTRRVRRSSDFVAAQGISRVNADADDISCLDDRGVERLERLVREDGRSVRHGRR
jgi:hypothetical protein